MLDEVGGATLEDVNIYRYCNRNTVNTLSWISLVISIHYNKITIETG